MRLALTAAVLAAAACSSPPTPPPRGVPPRLGPTSASRPPPPFAPSLRTPAVPRDHPLYDGYEAPDLANGCLDDGVCVRGGPLRSVCAAEDRADRPVAPAEPPDPAWSCGCVAGLCVWYTLRDR